MSNITFSLVENPQELLPVLKSRLPHSCSIYNEAMTWEGFKKEKKFYTLGPEINTNTWIILLWYREDYGQSLDISAPRSILEGESGISEEIRNSFVHSDVIQWDDRVLFPWLHRPVSAMMYDISVNVKGNVVEVHPHYLYYMDIETALGLEIKHDSSVEVGRINPGKDLDFILSNWFYARNGTREVLQKCVEKTASGGVFVNGECVSGAIAIGGMPCALYTHSDHRKKGFAKLTMLQIFRELAKEGCMPCSTVEIKNVRSNKFHESLGLKIASFVDWIEVIKLNID